MQADDVTAADNRRAGDPEPADSFLLGDDRSTQPGLVRQNRRQSGKTIPP